MIRIWYCFVPGIPCTPENPCDDLCGYVDGFISHPALPPTEKDGADATGPVPSP